MSKRRVVNEMIEEFNVKNKLKLSLYNESNLYTLKLNDIRISETMHSLTEVENALFLIQGLTREQDNINNEVTIKCYNEEKIMNREEAKEFYLDCMMNSEGSERDRYTTIYCKLEEGLDYCSDED